MIYIYRTMQPVIYAALMVLMTDHDHVATYTGVFLGICTLEGYAHLGNKLTKKGIFICIVIMILAIYFANDYSFCIKIASAVNMSAEGTWDLKIISVSPSKRTDLRYEESRSFWRISAIFRIKPVSCAAGSQQ